MMIFNQDMDVAGIEPYLPMEDVGWRVLDGDPQQSVRIDAGPLVGLWRCTPGTVEVPSTAHNEFMTILSGGLIVAVDDESSTELVPGDSLYIPAGQKVHFQVKETVTKYFIIACCGPVN